MPTATTTTSPPASTRAADGRSPAARGRGARSHPIDQPRVDRLLQDLLVACSPATRWSLSPHPYAKECCAYARTGLGEAVGAAGAPDGVIQVVEEPAVPLDRCLDDRPADRRHPGHRRRGDRARGVLLVKPGHRRGPGQRPGPRRRDRRPASRREQDGRQQGVRQLHPLHERERAHRGGTASPTGSCAKRWAATAATSLTRPNATGSGKRSSRWQVRAPPNPPWSARTRPLIADKAGVRIPPDPVLLAPFDLAVNEEPLAHEKLAPCSAWPGPDCPSRSPHGLGGAPHRRCRPLGGHPQQRRPTVMEYGAAVNVLRVRSTRAAVPAARVSATTWRRR